MKLNLFILPTLAFALTLAAGCQSKSHQSSTSSSGPAAAERTGPATVVIAPAQPATAEAASLKTIRIKAGGGAIKDSTGVEWLADIGFEGGDVIERPDLQIANTRQPEIYRSEHYSMDAFSYKIPNGKYQVKLHFCETYEGIAGPGERVFSFDVEGKMYKDFDVWVKAGGSAKAYVETVDVKIADGKLDIKFTPQVENPQINGVEIIPVP